MLRLQVKTPDGQGYDLSALAQDLQFSNVRPGGDESCTFTLLKSWLHSNPEVKRGSIVRVLDGLDTLWQGRLEELDRGADETETMQVTAYGLGARLKDGLFRQVFIDRDFESWREPSRTRRLFYATNTRAFNEHRVSADSQNGLPALLLPATGSFALTPDTEAEYDAGSDATIAQVLYSWTAGAGVTVANWDLVIIGATDDTYAATEDSGDLAPGSGSGTFTLSTPRRIISVRSEYGGGLPFGSEGFEYIFYFPYLVMIGNHGITLADSAVATAGFTAGQLISYIVGLVSGISARSVAAGSFVITQFVTDTPSSHQDALSEAAAFEVSTWGTWGPASVLDRSDNGYFDFSVLDPDSASGDWIIGRADCDDLDLHEELGSLYNQLRINWQDSSGEEMVESRSATIPVLDEAGITRVQELDAGPASRAIAQQLGDVYFALQGTNPPSRGSCALSMPVTHRSRGLLPPHYMRADGSTLKIRDVLPRSDAVSLGSADRRTIFPIQRVTVDASDAAVPKVSVDLDQTPDRLSVLQARTGLAAHAYGGGKGPVIQTPPVSSEITYTSEKTVKGKHTRRKKAGRHRK